MIAYQGAGRVLSPAEVEEVARWATEDLRPDLTVVLDVAPDQAVGVIAEKDRLEAAGDVFHRRVRQHFLALAEREPERYLVVDARRPREDIADDIQRPRRGVVVVPVGETGPMTRPEPGVWAELIGQSRSVAVLRRAVAGEPHAMSHAWLITGPPGSGRSNAARSFAAALQCERGFGCGECSACRTSLTGAHPDVTLVRTEQLSIGVDEVRELVRRAAMSPTLGRPPDPGRRGRRPGHRARRGRPVEEHRGTGTSYGLDPLRADRRRRGGHHPLPMPAAQPADARRTRPSPSCCRGGTGSIPRSPATRPASPRVTSVGPERLARDEKARQRRREVLQIPLQIRDLGSCLTAAANLVEATSEEAAAATTALDSRERAELEEALGFGTKGARPRQAQAAVKELEDQQKARAQATAAGRHRPGADRVDRLLPRSAQSPDRIGSRAHQRRPGSADHCSGP